MAAKPLWLAISLSIISKPLRFTRVIGKEALRGFLFLFVVAHFVGCASLDKSEYRQPVLILSDPPGAKIYDGSELIGTTPGYMKVLRRREVDLRYEFSRGETREVKLQTAYRWGGSFAMNLFVWGFAPVGWAYDLYTGTAWDIRDPRIERLGHSHQWPPPAARPPKIVAVAPPVMKDQNDVDELGAAISNRLREPHAFEVLDYGKTADQFHFYRSYQGLSYREENRYGLYAALKADHVLTSTAEERGNAFVVKSELYDVVTSKVDATYSWEIPVSGERQQEKSKILLKYFHLIPNTFFINLATYTPAVKVDGLQYKGKEAPSNRLGDKIFQSVSAVSIARLERSNYNVTAHWVIDFVPMLVLSKKKIVFTQYNPVVDAEFSRWYLSAGYGIEMGYMWRFGFIYSDFIPALTWTQINYDSPLQSGTIARNSFQINAEIGYSYFFSEHLVGRLYARTLNEDKEAWAKAISGASGAKTEVSEITSGYAGISIGYYFSPSTKRR